MRTSKSSCYPVWRAVAFNEALALEPIQSLADCRPVFADGVTHSPCSRALNFSEMLQHFVVDRMVGHSLHLDSGLLEG
ncbi:hypothetical protein OE398_33065, partial [Pseudomonas aeruginosa]|nr:hypothetical protein [Pseudomonas aeruginosa]